MKQLLLLSAATAATLSFVGLANARGVDDDKKATVETRLLKILKDRGVLSDKEFDELSKLGVQMRAEDVQTSAALEREIAELSEKLGQQATDAKKASSAPEIKTSYKFGKGVTFTDDTTFSMTIGGRLQIRFTYIQADGPTATGQDDRASFDVRRARIAFSGFAFNKDVTYKLEFDPASADPLRDAWINYHFSDEANIKGGQMERVFSRENRISSGDLMFPDRVSVVERFRGIQDYDVGAMLWGTFEEKKIEYYVGVNNGEGRNNGTPNAVNLGPNAGGLNVANESNNDSNGLEFVAVLVFNPNGPPGYSESDLERHEEITPSVGLNFSYNPERRGNPLAIPAGAGGIPAGAMAQYSFTTAGPDFCMKYLGFFVQAEAYWRGIQAEGSLTDTPGHFQYASETGWYAETSYLFGEEKNKGPELAGRFATINYDNSITPAGGTTQITDWTGGLNYYFAGNNLKAQLAYTYRINSFQGTTPTQYDNIVQLQVQLKF